MINSLLIGLLAAGVVTAPVAIQARLAGWVSPTTLFAAMLLLAAVIRSGSRYYDGMADLMMHIHSPAHQDPPRRWASRGLVSFFLNIAGLPAGREGLAIEWLQGFALRTRSWSARWSEQRRRSDAAAALAGAVSAAFGAPFAAILLPMELGIGGETLSAVLAAIAGFLGSRYIGETGLVKTLDLSSAIYDFKLTSWTQWLSILVIAAASGILAVAMIRFLRFSRDSLTALMPRRPRLRVVLPALLILVIALIYPQAMTSPVPTFENLIWYPKSAPEIALTFVAQFLTFSLVLAGFGTAGVFWPLFSLGALFGYAVFLWVLPGISGFAVVAALAGAAGLWGAVLGTPISAALLSFELTRNFHVLVPCLIAALLARWVKSRLASGTLVDRDLEARGMALHQGRSAAVLAGITVSEAMVTDHETVMDHEPVAELYPRIFGTRYQFLPVVNAQGLYQGLLTTDMIQEEWESQSHAGAGQNTPLASLFEAKDLLYRAGFKPPTVKPEDPLSRTAGLFRDLPCVPVVGEDAKILGLLFAHNVRLAYEREVMRRSLKREAQ